MDGGTGNESTPAIPQTERLNLLPMPQWCGMDTGLIAWQNRRCSEVGSCVEAREYPIQSTIPAC
jgi:hypothetical protein